MDEISQALLTRTQENLDSATVFSLLNSHGRDEMVLHYARVIGDHERIVNYWIAAGEWNKALVAIGSQVRLVSICDPSDRAIAG